MNVVYIIIYKICLEMYLECFFITLLKSSDHLHVIMLIMAITAC